jgi:hypothetical protein
MGSDRPDIEITEETTEDSVPPEGGEQPAYGQTSKKADSEAPELTVEHLDLDLSQRIALLIDDKKISKKLTILKPRQLPKRHIIYNPERKK